MIDKPKRLLQEQLVEIQQELLKRKKQPLRVYKPDDAEGHNQLIIHKSSAKYKLVYGGNQSGKTVTSAAEIAWWALGIHPYRKEVNERPRTIWVIGPEYRMIHEGVWRHLRPDGRQHNGMGFLPNDKIIKEGQKVPNHDLPSYLEVLHTSTDENGNPTKSRIAFISAEGGESARRRLQAAAVDLVVIDEEIDTLIFDELRVRCLSTDGEIINSATLVRSEPYALELEQRAEEGDTEVLLTRLSTAKNKHISERAKAEAFRGMSQDELDIRLHGKSRRNHGLVYHEFDQELHVIPELPQTLKSLIANNKIQVINAMDPGYRVWASLWFTFHLDTYEVIIYREMYLKSANLDDVASYIKQQEIEPVSFRTIDPKAYAHSEAGEMSIASQLAAFYDLSYSPAINDIDAGINAVHRVMPKLRVLKSCLNFLHEIRQYKIANDNSGSGQHSKPDKPLQRKNHLMDCLRYGIMSCIGHMVPSIKHSNFRPGQSFDNVQRGHIPAHMRRKIIHPILGSEW